MFWVNFSRFCRLAHQINLHLLSVFCFYFRQTVLVRIRADFWSGIENAVFYARDRLWTDNRVNERYRYHSHRHHSLNKRKGVGRWFRLTPPSSLGSETKVNTVLPTFNERAWAHIRLRRFWGVGNSRAIWVLKVMCIL